MNPIPTQIPLSNVLPNAALEKTQEQKALKNASHSFKSNLDPKHPTLLMTQGVRLIQSQVNKLQGNVSNNTKNITEKDKGAISASLIPSLLDDLDQSAKKESKETLDTQPETKIQALNELIGDFDLDKDTDFMDLSRWVMNINNEMSVDDK